MIIVTTDSLPGKNVVKVLGMVQGSTIRCTHLGADFMAMLHDMVGGEIPEYTSMIAQAREQAIDRMLDAARKMGANAVIGMRFATTEVLPKAAEVLAYGTAVVFE